MAPAYAVAYCVQGWGVEHSHHDMTAREALDAGLANPIENGDYSATLFILNGEIAQINIVDMLRSV